MITHNIPSYYRKIKEILIIQPDLALLSSPSGSNYPCLELILMVHKVFGSLKVYCIAKTRNSGQVNVFYYGVPFCYKSLVL